MNRPALQPFPPMLSRRALLGVGLSAAGAALLTGERWSGPVARLWPTEIAHPDLRRYVQAITDLPNDVWSCLALTAGLMAPPAGAARDLAARLPSGRLRAEVRGWTFREESNRARAALSDALRVYRALLPPARFALHARPIEAERDRLATGGQVDYLVLHLLATAVNRERGLMARIELDQLGLVQQHRADPLAQPRDVAARLAERSERRELAASFRSEAERLLNGRAVARFQAGAGPLTLLADLGASSGQPRSFQAVRAGLPNLREETLRARQIYYTAGEFLAVEPPAPAGRWADLLPDDQRAVAPTNALSPRLSRAAIIAPEQTSRVLWPDPQEGRALVADLRRL